MNAGKLRLEDTYTQIGRKLELLLHTGQALMENGANSSRIVRVMKRAAAYMRIPEEKLHIHITYTTIMVNVSDGDHSITKFQKCYKHGVDMTVISALSKLSIRALKENYPLYLYGRQLQTIRKGTHFYSHAFVTLGAGLACGGFCRLLGGDWAAAFYTAVCAIAGFWLRRQLHRFDFNPYISIFAAAFAASCLAFLTHRLPTATPWHPMLACALFIVPGVPLINAVDDLLENYIVSGMTRAANALLMVGSMSFGIALAIKLCGVADFTALSLEPRGLYLSSAAAAAIASAGFSTVFNTPRRLLWIVALGGALSVCTRNVLIFELGVEPGIASFTGAMAVSLVALKAVHWFHTPNHVLTIPSVIPLVPGVLLYRMLFGVININDLDPTAALAALQSGVNACLILLGIALGVAIPNSIAQKYLEARKRERLQRILRARRTQKPNT